MGSSVHVYHSGVLLYLGGYTTTEKPRANKGFTLLWAQFSQGYLIHMQNYT